VFGRCEFCSRVDDFCRPTSFAPAATNHRCRLQQNHTGQLAAFNLKESEKNAHKIKAKKTIARDSELIKKIDKFNKQHLQQ